IKLMPPSLKGRVLQDHFLLVCTWTLRDRFPAGDAQRTPTDQGCAVPPSSSRASAQVSSGTPGVHSRKVDATPPPERNARVGSGSVLPSARTMGAPPKRPVLMAPMNSVGQTLPGCP